MRLGPDIPDSPEPCLFRPGLRSRLRQDTALCPPQSVLQTARRSVAGVITVRVMTETLLDLGRSEPGPGAVWGGCKVIVKGLMSFWNDYLAGITAGAAAGYAITPIMTILDMSIIRSQFEHIGLSKALKSTTADLLTRRAKWNPAAGIMFGVYASTYITANTTRVYCNENKIDVVVPVALATSIVNSVTIALKDRAYARLFTGTPKYFPMSSLLLFGLRDGVTISSTFVVREEVRDWLEKDVGMQKETANLGSAFGLPMLAQFVATPFHVLALDKYERPRASLTSRLALIAENFVPVTAGRMLRIVPAFGIGGYLNDKIREAAESIVGIAAEPEPDMLQSHGARLLRRTTIV